MKRREKVSKKSIINIREYCENYLEIPFTWRGKLTHERLVEFARSKGRRLPRRGIFQKLSKEEILNGSYYLIEDETGKVIPYESQELSFESILSDLSKVKKVVLEQRREKILKEQGLIESTTGAIIRRGVSDPYAYDDIDDLGSILVKNNRVKKLINRRVNH